MGKVLFAELLQPKLEVAKDDGRGTYWSELQTLASKHGNCPVDWVVKFDTNKIRREPQYDKSEQVITYYLLAALSLATENFLDTSKLRSLFSRGFSCSTSVNTIVTHLGKFGWKGFAYEALICPTDSIRQAIQKNVPTIPIPYLQEIAQKKANIRFESPTHLDVFVGNQTPLVKGEGDVGFGLEAKFTSDIDSHTTYSTHRNQLIRNIEVGHCRFEKFFFTLITPRIYRERKSRFYVYKAEEYLGIDGPSTLTRDCLVPPTPEVAACWQKRFGYLCWEDIVEILFPNGKPSFNHKDADELGKFLRERMLL